MSEKNKSPKLEKFDLPHDLAIPGTLRKIMGQLAEEIEAKKIETFFEKLKAMGVEFDIEQEAKRTFKKCSRITEGTEESFYYDDGSVEGIRVVTFILDFDAIHETMTTSKKVSISYY